ncbi:MAG: hypothetical protein HY720_05605 [Planctomycetes bacterium]|nr:hypothetical protein [Planctomycetota bacterium]
MKIAGILALGVAMGILTPAARGQEDATAGEDRIEPEGADFAVILGPEEPAVDPEVWSLLSTSPDSSIPMVKIDGEFVLFTWGGIPLDSGEEEIGPAFCAGEGKDRLCDGMARLSGKTLDDLAFDPDSDSNRPRAVYRRPPVGPLDPRPNFSDMWPMGSYYDTASRELLIFNSSDDRPDEDVPNLAGAWYGTGELLVSGDGGQSFGRGGRILQPAFTKKEWVDAMRRFGSEEVGVFGITHSDAVLDPEGRYVYLYFAWQNALSDAVDAEYRVSERAGDRGSGLAVARAPIDVPEPARPGSWEFWFSGDFGSEGLGGKVGILLPDIHFFDVSWNEYLGRYVLIGSRWGVPLEDRGYDLYTSLDGISWTPYGRIWSVNNDVGVEGPSARLFPALFSPATEWDGKSSQENLLHYAYVQDPSEATARLLYRRSLRFEKRK